MSVGKRIKFLREYNKISQTELAIAIGVSKQTLYKYENDIITNIPSDKIEAIAKITNVTPAYIMGWTEEQSTQREIYNYPNIVFTILHMYVENSVENKEKILKKLSENRSFTRFTHGLYIRGVKNFTIF